MKKLLLKKKWIQNPQKKANVKKLDIKMLGASTVIVSRSKLFLNQEIFVLQWPHPSFEKIYIRVGRSSIQSSFKTFPNMSNPGVHTGRLRPEVQTPTILYTVFDRKGNPYICFHGKWYPFHIPTVETRHHFYILLT